MLREGTHKEHQIQPLDMHRTPQISNHVPERCVQVVPELWQVWSSAHSLGSPWGKNLCPKSGTAPHLGTT